MQERVPTLKLAQPGFLNIFTEAAVSVASMVAMPLSQQSHTIALLFCVLLKFYIF